MESKLVRPFISVVLPIARFEPPHLINFCLKSLAYQKNKDFEVIIINANNRYLDAILKNVAQLKLRIFNNSLNKTQARNFGAKKSTWDLSTKY
ncbi:MAG: hypothetical protein A2Y57_01295 [Candidatus Woykebacteria bacterium RBG_13_40_7b]|uniref:Glycosyltransferase 2-like domain-containing protein n=1 Tax=Candidatus Woykebacteria bacterium RBG_13_40_7b TaxID=1802594 RepID=A0A1G1WA70_9BACT|nr:MAG: hypothetical protein A2Y57_01295 [Candidatus Woykebacteria bacterium RBG_13_40_7b]